MIAANDITKLVGNTPLVKLRELSRETGAHVYGKVEYFNPLSSVKDRIAVSMIDDLEDRGLITPGGTLIEPTSGNTGVGLAFVCAARGYKLVLTMPESMSIERRKLLKALGAQLVLTQASGGMKGAIEKAQELCQKDKTAIMPMQFSNPANPEAHRKTTANEIWRDTEGAVDYFVCGIGTGGTITGVGEVLKERKSNLKVVAVEPDSSAVLSGEQAGPHKIQGIGAGFAPEVLNTEIYDTIITVSDEESGAQARKLAKHEGILVGISSGAAAAAVRTLARKEGAGIKNTTIVVILPDAGERYLSTWLFEN